MRLTVFMLAGLALLGSAQRARSQDDYVTLYSGFVFLQDYHGVQEELPPPPPPPPVPTVVDRQGTFNDGWALGAALGRYLGMTRLEGEFFYRNNTGNDWTVIKSFGPPTMTSLSGELNCYSSMFNVVREVPATQFLTPYVGGGLGLAVLDGELSTPTTDFEIDATEFAFQGIAGLRTQLTSRTSLMTEYRYFGATETDLTIAATSTPSGDFNYSSHNVLFGLQFTR